MFPVPIFVPCMFFLLSFMAVLDFRLWKMKTLNLHSSWTIHSTNTIHPIFFLSLHKELIGMGIAMITSCILHKNSNKHTKIEKIGRIELHELLPHSPHWSFFSNFSIFTILKMSSEQMLMIPTQNIAPSMFIWAILVATQDFRLWKMKTLVLHICWTIYPTEMNDPIFFLSWHGVLIEVGIAMIRSSVGLKN